MGSTADEAHIEKKVASMHEMAMNGWNGFSSADASPGPTPTARRGSRSKSTKQLKNGPLTPGSSAIGKATLALNHLLGIKPMSSCQKFCVSVLSEFFTFHQILHSLTVGVFPSRLTGSGCYIGPLQMPQG